MRRIVLVCAVRKWLVGGVRERGGTYQTQSVTLGKQLYLIALFLEHHNECCPRIIMCAYERVTHQESAVAASSVRYRTSTHEAGVCILSIHLPF